MRARRGFALLAAIWLVVAIATVALQFSLDARERRTVGILAAERGQQHALALGALALMQARLEEAIRLGPQSGTNNPNIARLRASDPWADADSLYTGTVYVDSMPVDVVVHDLGAQLNINQMTEGEFQSFYSFLLGDYSKSIQLSQAIMDWRDVDSIPRPSGAERDAYIKDERLALPTNAPFREVSDLLDVMGMTPDIYSQTSMYLTTHGTSPINLNTAPVPVLRAIPGMTDATLNRILQMRSQGQRISDVGAIFSSPQRGGRPLPGQAASQAVIGQFRARADVESTQLELVITARVGPQAPPSRLIAVVTRPTGRGGSVTIQMKQW